MNTQVIKKIVANSGCPCCTSRFSKHLTYINSFNLHNSMKLVLLSAFYIFFKTEKLRKLSKVTQLVSRGAGTQTQIFWPQALKLPLV